MSPLKVGLIGCGHIAQSTHLHVLTRLPDVDLVALAEVDAARRQEAIRRASAAIAVADYQELLGLPDVEAVVICLPNALHADAAIAALEARKHVYLEKPLATTLAEGRQVLAAWRQAEVVGLIGFNYRFNPLYQALRQQIRSGRLGKPISARSVFSTSSQTLPAWKQTRQSGGGVLLDLASHHIDLIGFLFGHPVRQVFAGLRSQQSEDDTAILELRLGDGLLVQSFFSLAAVNEDRFEIYGSAGKLAVDRYRSWGVEITGPTGDLAPLKRLGRGVRSLVRSPYVLHKLRAPGNEPSYRAALAHFVAAVRGDRPASPDFRDGYRSLAVVEAAEEAARSGRDVDVMEPDRGAATHLAMRTMTHD